MKKIRIKNDKNIDLTNELKDFLVELEEYSIFNVDEAFNAYNNLVYNYNYGDLDTYNASYTLGFDEMILSEEELVLFLENIVKNSGLGVLQNTVRNARHNQVSHRLNGYAFLEPMDIEDVKELVQLAIEYLENE